MDANMNRRDLLKLLAALGTAATGADLAKAKSPATADLHGGKIVFENDKVRVIEHFAKPRLGVCGEGMHSHPPHLTVLLTANKARVTMSGKEPFIFEGKAGDVFWDPGGAHAVENIGSRDSKVYLIEIKDA
jgi:hypothetical protein